MKLLVKNKRLPLDIKFVNKEGRKYLMNELLKEYSIADVARITGIPYCTVSRYSSATFSKINENDKSSATFSKINENDKSSATFSKINENDKTNQEPAHMTDDEALLFVRTSVAQFKDSDEVSWDAFAAKRGLFSLNVLPQFLQKGIKELEEKKLKRWGATPPEYCLRFFALESDAPLWDEWAAPRGIPLVKSLTKEIQEQIRKVERQRGANLTWEDAY